MQPRQILIVAGVAIVAFAAAFGIAGAGGGEESKAAAAGLEPAEVIQVSDKTGVSTGGTDVAGLPALQVPKKKKPKPDTSSSGGTTTTTTTTTTAPTTTTTAPTTTAPTTTAPTVTSPPPSNDGSGSGPLSVGGGED